MSLSSPAQMVAAMSSIFGADRACVICSRSAERQPYFATTGLPVLQQLCKKGSKNV